MHYCKSHHYNILIAFLLLLFESGSFVVVGQTNIGGVINSYAKVSAVNANSIQVDTQDQANRFMVGDTILLIQMKGVVLNSGSDYGGIQGSPDGAIGLHEFLIISSISGRTIGFSTSIVHYGNFVSADNFDVNANVQIIRTPSYSSANVTSILRATPWDSTTGYGGVVAFFAGKSLELHADIDVSGQGFAGAEAVLSDGAKVEINEDLLDKYSCSALNDTSGLKGEGIGYLINISGANVPIYPTYAKGKAPNYSGGGGGNGAYSGGGGGSNGGAGGLGGSEKINEGFRFRGGLGGKRIPSSDEIPSALPSSVVRLFLGGGGGGSTYSGTGIGVDAGNGGGIVIIVCDSIIGNGYGIVSNGETPFGTASLNNGGAGGGGAGGSIGIYTSAFANSQINITANGGNGGNGNGGNSHFGDGGGGGGGIVAFNSNYSVQPNVSVAGGQGFDNDSQGNDGSQSTNFMPLLNGFLFNSIWFADNGTRTDSVCQNNTTAILGTNPTGVGPFTYYWQTTTDRSSRSSYNTILGGRNYYNVSVSDTTWIRRIVIDNGSNPSVSDTSNWVQLIYHPAISNNVIGPDETTICVNQSTQFVSGNVSLQGGNGIYSYSWQRLDNGTWNTISGARSPQITTDRLNQTTSFVRVVNSGSCVSTSNIVTANVLPAITGNVVAQDQQTVFCEGVEMEAIEMTDVVGGNNSYIYSWQQSQDNVNWVDARGSNNSSTYTPDESSFNNRTIMYYRRMVYSGPNNVCSNISQPILITRYFSIENNTISMADNTICSGSVPATITASQPSSGSGSYTYVWQSSTNRNTWRNVGTDINYTSSESLTDTTWFRRIVNSAACADTSALQIINVHKPIVNNNITLASGARDTTILMGERVNLIVGSVSPVLHGGTDLLNDYAFQWYVSTDNRTFSPISGATSANYSPGVLTAGRWYLREAISGNCTNRSEAVAIIVLSPISNNTISGNQSVCYNSVPETLRGTLPIGGDNIYSYFWQRSTDGTIWTNVSGGNQQNLTLSALQSSTQYRRIVYSGANDCCVDTSNVVTINVNPLPVASIVNHDASIICEGEEVLIQLNLTGSPNFTVVYSESGTLITERLIAPNTTIHRIPSVDGRYVDLNYSLHSVVDGNGCAATSLSGSTSATVYNTPDAYAGVDDSVCGPEYTLSANAIIPGSRGQWIFPEDITGDSSTNQTTVRINEDYLGGDATRSFVWEITDGGVCVGRDTVNIKFFREVDEITAGDDYAFGTFDNVVKLNGTEPKPYETGSWSVVNGSGSFADEHMFDTYVSSLSENNTFRWTIENGACSQSATIDVERLSVEISEGLSPNGDGINDMMTISGIDLSYQDAELTILNGAGRKIYSTSNKNGNTWDIWDGKNDAGKEMPEGTYYYILKVSSRVTDITATKSGFVVLKRK